MLKKPHSVILILVVLLVGVLIKLPASTSGRTKLALTGLFVPMFGLSGSLQDMTSRAEINLISKAELARQVEDLRRQNSELQLRLQQETAVWAENARLRDLVGWPRQTSWKVKLARVTARDPSNWWRSLQIDLGTRDGVKPNLPVVTAEGLVGRIQTTEATRSQVVLLGSPELRVAAVVEPSGETGIINTTTSAPQEEGRVDLDYLAGNSKVHPGQDVLTWGEGGVFPAKIPIGKIFDVRTKDYGLATEARVTLAANLGALQEVWVVIP
jgi:rod shape-determining protein MreC